MSVIKRFNTALFDIGIPSLEDSAVFYTSPVAIRFEIGGDESIYISKMFNRTKINPLYVNEALNRALTILDDLPKNNWIIKIDFYNKKDINKTVKVFNLGISDASVTNAYELDGDSFESYELYWEIDYLDSFREKLLKEIILSDIGGNLDLSSSVYLMNTEHNILFHLYDDRGLDVAAHETSTIEHLYHKYNHWILDYDRKEINKIFNE